MPKKFIVIIINFIMVVILVWVISGQVDKYKGLTDVYVAKTHIAKGVKITNEMLELKKITLNREAGPNSKDRATYYDDVIKDANKIVGQYAAYDMIAGEIIIADKITDEVKTSENYLLTMPKGYYAYAIPAGTESEAGLVKVNDYIDLYINFKGAEIIDEPALRHLRVYDLVSDEGKSITPDSKDSEGNVPKPKFMVLVLNDFQLRKLVGYENQGAVMKAGLRKRPNTEYEIFNNPETAYPTYSILPDQIIDEKTEQALIEQNKQRVESEAIEKQFEKEQKAKDE